MAARRDRCALARRVRRTAAGADRGAEPDRPGKPADGRRGGAANARRAAVPAAAAGAAGGHRPVDRALCVAIGRPVRRRPAAGRALAQPRTPRRRRRVRLLPAGRPAGVRYVVGDLSLAAAGPSRGSAARVRARRRARTLVRSGRHPPARPRVGRAGPQDAGAAGAGPCLGRRAVDDGGARGVGRLQAAANAAQFAAPGPDGGQPPLDGPGRRLRGEADPRHGGREQQRSRGRRARGACGRRRRGHGRAPRGRRSPARPSHRRVVRPRERRRRRTEALAALGRRRRRRTVLWHPLPGRSRPDALLRQGQPDRRPGPRAAGARRTDAVLRPSTRQTRRLSGSHSEAATPSLSYVVPTIGVPAHLAKCLESIYRDGGRLDSPPELVVVWQAPLAGDGGGAAALKELCRRLDAARPGAIDGAPRIVELPRPAGFARAVNDGIAVSTGDWVALVNDDVALEAGWARRLLEAVAAGSGVAAVQGVNVVAGGDEGDDDRDGARIDGAGLAWNRRWQAVQLGRGEPASGAGLTAGPSPGRLRRRPAGTPAHPVCDLQHESVLDVYGVSATAAIYRRAALAEVSGGGDPLRPFEERLDSYYEDVELADRLRGAGYRALLVPAARAVHAGALSSRSPRAARRRTRRVYANRLLVLARRLGRGFWPRLPGVLGRDVVDVVRRPKTAPMPGDLKPPGAVDLVCAWGRAVRLLPGFVHFGGGAEERSRPDVRRVSKPPSAAAGGDAGAPSVERRRGDR
ncbi:MAG: glycosyltransferase family 2 protein, partial [Holophagales bacterium]|nr:glycosyltransferase family 2 protein [Holophagales bacterium]